MARLADPNKIVRFFCGKDVTPADRQQIAMMFGAIAPGTKVAFNKSGRADLAVVLNYDPMIHWVVVKRGTLLKWLLEPVLDKGISRRFGRIHSRKYDVVYSSGEVHRKKTAPSPPLYPSRLSPEYTSNVFSRSDLVIKSRMVSIISSRLSDLEGHQKRNALIELLNAEFQGEVDVFGRGRAYLDLKEHGLVPYRYSFVIENSFAKDYWSEKVSDAFLCDVVPIYLGASNLSEYFPKESYIALEKLDVESIGELLEGLSVEDYERRLPAVKLAKELILTRYNLAAAIEQLADARGQGPGRLVLTPDSSTFVHWFLKVVSPLMVALASALRRVRQHQSPR